jgi:hypothetical protein
MRARLAQQEKLLDAFFTAEDAVEAARQRYDEAVTRAQAGVDSALQGRAGALADLAEAVGNTRETADLTGASAREIRQVRKSTERVTDADQPVDTQRTSGTAQPLAAAG